MKKNTLIIVLLLVILSSCKTVYITDINKYSELNPISSNARFTVIGSKEVLLREFTKTFYKNYQTKEQFADRYIMAFGKSLRKAYSQGYVSVDTLSDGIYNSLKFDVDGKLMTIDSSMNKTNSDYLVIISDLTIDNSLSIHFHGQYNASSNEYCVIRAKYKIFDFKTGILVYEFVSSGKGKVELLNFESAFFQAFKESTSHAMIYIKHGIIEF